MVEISGVFAPDAEKYDFRPLGTGEDAPRPGSLALNWRAPGPVCEAFVRSRADVKCIMGPIGSGKTTAAMFDGIACGYAQPRSPVDGIRYYMTALCRATYRDLWRSSIPSWFELIGYDTPEFTGGRDQPAVHRLLFNHPNGGVIQYTMLFLALGEDWEATLRGLQVSAWIFEEGDQLPIDMIDVAGGRTRYPQMIHGGAWWDGVAITANAFDLDSEHYERFVIERREGDAFFVQPSALAPNAENVRNLKANYYPKQMRGSSEDYIRKYIRNEFGYSKDGKPVLPEFQPGLHVADRTLQPNPNLAIKVGSDAGLLPAAVIGQQQPDGVWWILDEIWGHEGGAGDYGRIINQLLDQERYRAVERAFDRDFTGGEWCEGWIDPSGVARSPAAEGDETRWIQVLAKTTGLRWRPAPSNSLSLRLEAVRQPLTRGIGTGRGLLISPVCRVLIRALASKYRFKRILGPDKRYAFTPEKNEFANVAEALQYLLLGGGEFYAVRGRDQKRRSRAHGGGERVETDAETAGLIGG